MSSLINNIGWLFGYGPRTNFACQQEREMDRAFIDEYLAHPNSHKLDHAQYSVYLYHTKKPLTHDDYHHMYRIMGEKEDVLETPHP